MIPSFLRSVTMDCNDGRTMWFWILIFGNQYMQRSKVLGSDIWESEDYSLNPRIRAEASVYGSGFWFIWETERIRWEPHASVHIYSQTKLRNRTHAFVWSVPLVPSRGTKGTRAPGSLLHRTIYPSPPPHPGHISPIGADPGVLTISDLYTHRTLSSGVKYLQLLSPNTPIVYYCPSVYHLK